VQLEINKNMGEFRAGARRERIILLSPARTRKVMAETYGRRCVLGESVKLIKKRLFVMKRVADVRDCVYLLPTKVVFFQFRALRGAQKKN
jgi:hypothetical protein